jgi:DNA replication protein DnaC
VQDFHLRHKYKAKTQRYLLLRDSPLGLKAVEARLESLLEQASKKEPSYADFLDELLSCEVDARRSRYLRARVQLAHMPFLKSFDQFDFGFQPSIDERQIQELRSLLFIHEVSNVVFLGPPGVGKTHLSVALAEAADSIRFRSLLHDRARPGDRSGPGLSRRPAGPPHAFGWGNFQPELWGIFDRS